MKNLIITEINDGYIEPVIKDEDYIFGSSPIPDIILQPNGQWNDFLPEEEPQQKSFDTFGCTIFTTENQTETFERRVFGKNVNYSDRAGYIMANIVPPGADPQTIYEMIRKKGLLVEERLPWTPDIDTLEKYSQPNPLPQSLLDEAKQWVSDIFFKHEYLPTSNGQISPETLKEALKRSVLAVGVYAWAFAGEKYVRMGADTHWTIIYGFEDGQYWLVYDTYPPFTKKLDWNFGFKTAKRIYIRKKTAEEKKLDNMAEQVTLMQKVVDLLRKVIYFLTS